MNGADRVMNGGTCAWVLSVVPLYYSHVILTITQAISKTDYKVFIANCESLNCHVGFYTERQGQTALVRNASSSL